MGISRKTFGYCPILGTYPVLCFVKRKLWDFQKFFPWNAKGNTEGLPLVIRRAASKLSLWDSKWNAKVFFGNAFGPGDHVVLLDQELLSTDTKKQQKIKRCICVTYCVTGNVL